MTEEIYLTVTLSNIPLDIQNVLCQNCKINSNLDI